MRKPETPNMRQVLVLKQRPRRTGRGMNERRQVIEEEIRTLRELLKRLWNKLH
jgi:hypothetical protein